MSSLRAISIVFAGVIACLFATPMSAQKIEKLTEEQMKEFLLNAKVIRSRKTGKGVTSPYRLTLSDGAMTHDAGFQYVDEQRKSMEFWDGTKETNFRNSYKYSIAAYELAKLLGLGDMMPVTVQRSCEGKKGALTWWLPVKMDESERLKKHIVPPDPDPWNHQMHRMRVFAELVYDTDRNLGNVLISEDWHIWMIDFSRAFRLYHTLKSPKNLVKCDRQLLEKLRQLDSAEVQKITGEWLNSLEISGVMARRDKIVAHFERLIAQKGEKEVLY